MMERHLRQASVSRRLNIEDASGYHGEGIDTFDELTIALTAIGDIRQSIQHADTKAGMLGALLGLTIAGATNQLDLIKATIASGGALHTASVILLLIFTVTLFAAGTLLGLAQVPRLPVSPGVQQLAFPSLARMGRSAGRLSAADLRDEAWSQAETLSQIALRKFRYVRASLACSGLCVGTFLLWLGPSSLLAH